MHAAGWKEIGGTAEEGNAGVASGCTEYDYGPKCS